MITSETNIFRDMLPIVADSHAEPFLICDTKFTILASNSSAQDVFGYTESEFALKRVTDLMQEAFREMHESWIVEYGAQIFEEQDDPLIRSMNKVVALKKNGRQFLADISVTGRSLDRHRVLYISLRQMEDLDQSNFVIFEAMKLLHTDIADLDGSEGLIKFSNKNPKDLTQARIAWVSPEWALKVLGYSPDELIKMLPATDLLLPRELENLQNDSLNWDSDSFTEEVYPWKTKGGDVRYIRFKTIQGRGDEKQDLGLARVSIVRDVTDRVLAERQRKIDQKALEDSRQSTENLMHFIVSASHAQNNFLHECGLRLVELQRDLDIMLKEGGAKEQMESVIADVDSVHNVIQRMGRGSRNILNLREIKSGESEILASEFSLTQVLERITSFDSQITVDTSLCTLDSIFSDVNKIECIIENLTYNSKKFASETLVRVESKITDPTQCKGSLEIEVSDNGPGISEEVLSRIFEMGNCGDKSRGHGLGLNICHELVNLLGGQITVHNKLEGGACFTVKIPVNTLEKGLNGSRSVDSLVEVAAPRDLGLRKGLRVLIAEDHSIIRRVIQKQLNRTGNGYLLDVVADGQAAVDIWEARWLEGRPFDLLILDKNMTVEGNATTLDGDDAIRIIRQREMEMGRHYTPAVAFTGSVSELDECMSAGMDAYIMKPCSDIDELVAMIDEWGIDCRSDRNTMEIRGEMRI
ncbi:hypothetical protein SCG7086_AE_00190 [Chlamydiales bacterium SCGC AG-110-P3]|nr:hypothetical protein SCG7086_AE_00190 [Chlamydiales bacterium SCGC AG-110-P3]